MTVPVSFLKKFFKSRWEMLNNVQETAREFSSKDAVKRYNEFKEGNYTVDSENFHDYTEAFLAKIQESARDEVIKLTNNGTRQLTLTDRPSTPYLNAVIGEIQRHTSILNVNFRRINNEPTYMGGHLVDSGALVTAQLNALHLNETVFKNQKEFDPERFLRDEKLLQKVIPFGFGKRSCLGESLARSELYLIFGNLLLRYNFKPTGELSTEELLPYSKNVILLKLIVGVV
ncbi:hypothetical protein GCK72_020130 [Caenorhabditis remanei]|uniref:Uncharacterized protein n=1 Tax=Caenorhabditis remanei TaxID=31234 RepID=A0A6A5GFX8_CAERE|nr:hypothetical protein GCK72_020130 [Caenorhabditis remanei]KAF1753573.1 hypothetical protein GCK72_020130 [Caenorhabditis remanei]